ncbi:MAG: hypothetical protein RI897_2087 [Verrucomicrobiota bacterium]
MLSAFVLKGLLFRGGEEVADLGPVHHTPDGLEIVGTAVLVFEVVGMFPDIDAEDGGAFATGDGFTHEGVILVGGGSDGDLASGREQPDPAAAEAAGAGGFELGFEFIEGAEGCIDGIGQGAGGVSSGIGGEELPEERMVPVASAVVADCAADVFRHGGEVTDQGFEGLCFEVGISSDGLVEVSHIGVVMFAMVDFHGHRVDVGFEGFLGVGKCG